MSDRCVASSLSLITYGIPSTGFMLSLTSVGVPYMSTFCFFGRPMLCFPRYTWDHFCLVFNVWWESFSAVELLLGLRSGDHDVEVLEGKGYDSWTLGRIAVLGQRNTCGREGWSRRLDRSRGLWLVIYLLISPIYGAPHFSSRFVRIRKVAIVVWLIVSYSTITVMSTCEALLSENFQILTVLLDSSPSVNHLLLRCHIFVLYVFLESQTTVSLVKMNGLLDMDGADP